MSLGYRLIRCACLVVRNQCVREFVVNARSLRRPGGFVIACTHLGHVEPGIVSSHTTRQIRWVARIEFFRHPVLSFMLRWAKAIPVDRQGPVHGAIRRAIAAARAGEIVGIFPEGGVIRSDAAMFRGGPFKHGACVIAMRGGVPIIPVVILGTDALMTVAPWLPAKRARVWVIYGEPIPPPREPSRRVARKRYAEQLQAEVTRLYERLLAEAAGHDGWQP